jgi:hypothetical protein
LGQGGVSAQGEGGFGPGWGFGWVRVAFGSG